jgi:hypothetical protein
LPLTRYSVNINDHSHKLPNNISVHEGYIYLYNEDYIRFCLLMTS